MSAADGNDTRPGWRSRSSRPPAADSDLPEPLMPPAQTHVAELHRDLRSLRTEMLNRQEAARSAINEMQLTVTRIDAAMKSVSDAQTRLHIILAEGRRRDRWVGVVGVALLAVLLAVLVLRMYGQIGAGV